MKQKVFTMVAGILMIFGTVGSAMAVTFDEVPLYTPDPLIDGVQFFAGDPMLWNDTYVDGAWSPGNPYLASGYDDGTGSSPGLYDTFIGASAQGFSFDSVALNIASEMWLPPNTELTITALAGGMEVASTSLTVSDNAYHAMSLSYASGFDTVYIWDDMGMFGLSSPFHIDDFGYTEYTGGPGGEPIPEPATMFLFGTGLVGFAALRKRTRKS